MKVTFSRVIVDLGFASCFIFSSRIMEITISERMRRISHYLRSVETLGAFVVENLCLGSETCYDLATPITFEMQFPTFFRR